MQYRIYFTSGLHLIVNKYTLDDLVRYVNSSTAGTVLYGFPGHIVNVNQITHVVEEPTVENAGSAVIKPQTPDDLKTAERRRLEEIRSDPNKLINRIKDKAENEK